MPLIKLNRINKGGAVYVNSDHILFMEVEFKTTTLHLIHNLLYSVEEPLEAIAQQIEKLEAARIAQGIQQSGLGSLKS